MPKKLHTLATKKQAWVISRYQEGISLNPKEYILDAEDGELMEFDSVDEALDYLNQHGGLEQKVTSELEAYDVYGVDIELQEESY
tara:strand:+ start:3188 stop:3442 length:255 start_codon:yes stop_codon:yes gene_type:complete